MSLFAQLASSMINKSRLHFFRILLLFFGAVLPALGAETWTVGDKVYTNVVVRDVNPETVVILHERGLSSLPLKSLPADLKVRFGYDDALANAHREALAKKAQAAQEELKASEAAQKKARREWEQRRSEAEFDVLLSKIDEPLKVFELVDLRERFAAHELYARNQGRRPSCSVFAVASALGYALAESGHPGAISEEYLLWATVEHLRLFPARVQAQDAEGNEPGDLGFSLASVVQAALSYGAALQHEMPNNLGGRFEDIEAPSEALIERSRARHTFKAAQLKGRNNAERVESIMKVLNAGWPVSIGAAWPPSFTLQQAALVDAQTPRSDYSHAVTLVGYAAPGGNLDNCVFIFRNSWGVRWGRAGYGFISRRYLLENLNDAIIIGVE